MWMINYHLNCLLHHTSWKGPSLTKFDRYVFISLAIPLQYFVLAPVTTALCLTLAVVTAGKPDPNTLGVCFTVYFHRRVASSPPSFHLLPSFIVCSVAQQRRVRWDGNGDTHKKICPSVCVCVCVCVCVYVMCVDVITLWQRQMHLQNADTVCNVACVCAVHVRETCSGCKWALLFCGTNFPLSYSEFE